MVSVEINSVWKYYGKTVAVKELNIQCPTESFYPFLVRRGAASPPRCGCSQGSSTFRPALFPLGGSEFNELAPKDRDIAMVFENYALYPHKTVYDNIANPLRLRNVGSAEIEKVRRAAELLEMAKLLKRKPQELSGGQKQRTAIGRAIVRETACVPV